MYPAILLALMLLRLHAQMLTCD